MKKLLITGGAGFIGSNFINYMLERYKNYRIVNLDVLTYAGNLENLVEVENNSNYRFVKGCITNAVLLDKLFEEEKFDYVINFAAESHVDRSINDPTIFIKTNVLGTQILLEAAKKHWQTGKDKYGYPMYRQEIKFFQVSTDEVYGSLNRNKPFNEEAKLLPNNPYAASKASADLIVRAYSKTYKLPMNITRGSNSYGQYQFPEKLIPLTIVNCLRSKSIPVYGDGTQTRDWIHVKDHCAAIDTVLHKGTSGEVYNIGGNNEKANIEIVKLIINTIGEKFPHKGDSLQVVGDCNIEPQAPDYGLIEYVEDRLGHDKGYLIDNSKITTELGWSASYTFEQGIKETIDWYFNNQGWLENVINKDYLEYYEKMYYKNKTNN